MIAKAELFLVAPKQHMRDIQDPRPMVTLRSVTVMTIELVEVVRDSCDLEAIFDQHMSMIPQVNTIWKCMYNVYCLQCQIGKI